MVNPSEVRAKAAALNREVMDKLSTLATSALGLVAALAWNNAIQSVFKHYYPAPDDPTATWPLVGYAVIVTLIAVLVILTISRTVARLKQEHEKAKASRTSL